MKIIYTLFITLLLSACTPAGNQPIKITAPTPPAAAPITYPKQPENKMEKTVYCFLAGMEEQDIYSLCTKESKTWKSYLAPDIKKCTDNMNKRIESYTDRGIDYISPEGEVYMEGGVGHEKCGIHIGWHTGVSNLKTLKLRTLEQNKQTAVVNAEWYSSVERMQNDSNRISPDVWARFFLQFEKDHWAIWAIVDKAYIDYKYNSH